MKRREFARACGLALASASALPSLPVQAQLRFESGKDYLPLGRPAPVDAPSGKVEVVEFFWYSCPHCNAFEPSFEAWAKRLPKEVALRRVPVAFQPSFIPQQKLYYALEAMGLVDKLHTRVFQAIHGEHKRLENDGAITDWVVSQGVDRAKFLEQYNSFSMASRLSRGNQLTEAYKVEGVPAMGVAGRFYTDGSLTNNMDRCLQVVDYLVSEVRRGH